MRKMVVGACCLFMLCIAVPVQAWDEYDEARCDEYFQKGGLEWQRAMEYVEQKNWSDAQYSFNNAYTDFNQLTYDPCREMFDQGKIREAMDELFMLEHMAKYSPTIERAESFLERGDELFEKALEYDNSEEYSLAADYFNKSADQYKECYDILDYVSGQLYSQVRGELSELNGVCWDNMHIARDNVDICREKEDFHSESFDEHALAGDKPGSKDEVFWKRVF